MMRRVLFASSVACLIASPILAAETPPPSISTSGEAVIYVRPDEVVVTFGVETRDAKLDNAKKANDDASGRLLKALKGLGIEDKNIQTDRVEFSLLYTDAHRLTVEGYRAHRSYCVKLKDVAKFELAVETALKNGANELASFEYRTSELRKHRDQARSMAIKAAKEKATALAKELDCKLGKPRSISEGAVWSGYFGNSRYGNVMAQNSAQVAPGGEAGDGTDTLPLGQIAIRANVSTSFDLVTGP